MFSYFSSVKAKGISFLFAALVLVLLAGFLVSCGSDSSSDSDHTTSASAPNGLLGKWVDPESLDYHQITRSGSADTYKYYNPPMTWEGVTYPATEIVGTIRFVSYNNNSGIIIYECTKGAPA